MRLRPLYTVRFFYPKDQAVEIKNPKDANALGREEEMFFFAEGTCEGLISGRFKGANHPRRRADNTAVLDLQGFIETDDGALIMTVLSGLRPLVSEVARTLRRRLGRENEVPQTGRGHGKALRRCR